MPKRQGFPFLRSYWPVFLLLLVGLVMRVAGLDQLPQGLWIDEANHGLEAREILQGAPLPIFFPANNGQEPFFKYLVVALFWFLGDTVFSLRLAAAVSGWFLLLLSYIWVKQEYGKAHALWALAFMTFGVWHLHFSRFALRAIVGTPFAVLSLIVARRFIRCPSILGGSAAGLVAALNWYTYPSFKLFPAVLALILFLERGSWWKPGRWRYVIAAVVGFSIGILPLLNYWADNPLIFTSRVGITAVWRESADVPMALMKSLLAHLGMFTFRGDSLWRSNHAGAPQLDPITGIFFIVGMVLSTARRSKSDKALLGWLGIMLLPSVIADVRQAPSAIRTMGVLPVPYVLASLGMVGLIDRIQHRKLIAALCFMTILSVPTINILRYFVSWPTAISRLSAWDADQYTFNPTESKLGVWLKQRDDSEMVWLTPQLYLHSTVAFLADDVNYGMIGDLRDLRGKEARAIIIANPEPRNLWWLYDSPYNNYHRWWLSTGCVDSSTIWNALFRCYLSCNEHLLRCSDDCLISEVSSASATSIDSTTLEPLWILTTTGSALSDEGISPQQPEWLRLPPGCFRITLEPMGPSAPELVVTARQDDESSHTEICRGDLSPGRTASVEACLFFPASVKVQTSPPGISGRITWSFTGTPDQTVLERDSIWYKVKLCWARAIAYLTGT